MKNCPVQLSREVKFAELSNVASCETKSLFTSLSWLASLMSYSFGSGCSKAKDLLDNKHNKPPTTNLCDNPENFRAACSESKL